MKIKPLSKIHRAAIIKRNDWGTDLLRIKIQVKSTICYIVPIWQTACWIDIEVDNYWVVPGHERDGPMTLNYQFGGTREIWPPDIFDLEDKIHRLYQTYLQAHQNVTDCNKVIENQIKKLA